MTIANRLNLEAAALKEPAQRQLCSELGNPFAPGIANRLMQLLGNEDVLRTANTNAYA